MQFLFATRAFLLKYLAEMYFKKAGEKKDCKNICQYLQLSACDNKKRGNSSSQMPGSLQFFWLLYYVRKVFSIETVTETIVIVQAGFSAAVLFAYFFLESNRNFFFDNLYECRHNLRVKRQNDSFVSASFRQRYFFVYRRECSA